MKDVAFFFAKEEIDTSRVSLSPEQSRVLTIQKGIPSFDDPEREGFWKHCRRRREWWLKTFFAKEEIDTSPLSLSTKFADFWWSKKGRFLKIL